jgi:hypothetical protein
LELWRSFRWRREMHQSWAEFRATPTYVIDYDLKFVEIESEVQKTLQERSTRR